MRPLMPVVIRRWIHRDSMFVRVNLSCKNPSLLINSHIRRYSNMATLPSSGWSNATGTGDKSCPCGTWKAHWLKHSGKSWPSTCSVVGCSNAPTLGAHVKNSGVTGNRITPMCDDCNQRTDTFSLSGTLTNADTNS